MGAKYLNEIDLGSREECLRLCCETDNCDVFVFEEKSPGSCYLFHCGPPEDFKCKFTRHVNYTSAVLAINRHTELETEIKMTKHEQDLTRLRKPDDTSLEQINPVPVSHHETTINPGMVPSTTTQESSKDLLIESTNTVKESSRTCSRYQFECRSTSECIAIYNACDGIPQCADGSDEAPELGCPATTTAPSSAFISPSFSPILAHQQLTGMKSPPRPNFPNYDQTSITKYSEQRPQLKDSNLQPPNNLIQYNNNGPDRNPFGSGIGNGQQRIPSDLNSLQIPPPRALPVMSASAYNNGGDVPRNNLPIPQQALPQPQWIPRQTNEMPADMLSRNQNQYPDQNSHIFNHKLNQIQVGDTADSLPQMHYGDVPKLPNFYNNEYKSQMQLPEAWQQMANGQQDPLFNPYLQNDLHENWPQMQLPQNMLNRQAFYPPSQQQQLDLPVSNWKSPSKLKDNKKLDENNSGNSGVYDKTLADLHQDKKNISSNSNNDTLQQQQHLANKNNNTTKQQTIKKNNSAHHETKKHHHSHQHQQHTPMASELKMTDEFVEMEEITVDKPSGAILSLTLGLCITMIMVAIVGCRLRVVRKRMRRGGKSPYAHDADYLVNGMYL
ncbi:nuclear transcription factor Y subunit beta [Chrysoperla carnea]|uniref:nuclear transcription factor Y subunit beta n=1 Tax=Chrysoperla carnea TaxID=189513 RepID=UPI001D077FE6|nr:nuclear transcription factor Y subunit beta [Chrysoperla carnea]